MHERFRAASNRYRFLIVMATVAASVAMLPAALLSACASAPSGVTTATATTHTGPLVYVALGASDGVGVGTSDPARDNWPTVLSGELGQTVHLENLSISGETVGEALKSQLPIAVKDSPDLVTVWLGVNDLVDGVPLATYTDQLTTLLHSLHQQTRARIYVANVPNLALLPAARSYSTTMVTKVITQWNVSIAKVTAAQGATLVDLYGASQELARNPQYISADGFHPSTAGAQRLAQFFAGVIRKSLGSQPAA